MGMLRACAAVALLVPATACSEPFVVPTTLDECHRASPELASGSQEGSSGLMVAHAESTYGLGAAGTLYVCLPHEGAATLSIDAPEGVTVDPDPLTVPGDGAVPELSVTVADADADGERVAIGYDDGDLAATVFAELEVDGDEWSFREP